MSAIDAWLLGFWLGAGMITVACVAVIGVCAFFIVAGKMGWL